MAPQPPRATRANPLSVGPRAGTEARPQETPEGHVQEVVPSTQAQDRNDEPEQPNPNFILVPRNQDILIPADLALQLVALGQRAELANQARSFRVTRLEEQLADLRGQYVADQGSPGPEDNERRNPARQRQRRSPQRENRANDPPRHHSSWASSSPTRSHRDPSRSEATSREESHHEHQVPRHHHAPPARHSSPKIVARNPFTRQKSPDRTNTGTRRNPYTNEINDFPTPSFLRKPPEKIPIFTGVGDPERHITKYDELMEYRYVPPEIRCKIFSLSLDGIASDWFRSLPAKSVSTWE